MGGVSEILFGWLLVVADNDVEGFRNVSVSRRILQGKLQRSLD